MYMHKNKSKANPHHPINSSVNFSFKKNFISLLYMDFYFYDIKLKVWKVATVLLKEVAGANTLFCISASLTRLQSPKTINDKNLTDHGGTMVAQW